MKHRSLRASRDDLRVGALHALAHSATLLEDAALLYANGRFANAFVLGVLAREELGRTNLLWTRAKTMGETESIGHDALKTTLKDHVNKLRAGQSITSVALDRAKVFEWRTAIEAKDKATVQAISKEIRDLVKRRRKRDPDDLHKERFKAQYVDLLPNGDWSTPAYVGSDATHALISTVLAEIANTLIRARVDRAVVETLAKADPTLALPELGTFTVRVLGDLARFQ